MEAFLQSVAKYIYKNYANQLHEIAIIFPNKRARLFFNNYLSELTTHPVFTPGYFTISELMQNLANEVPADNITLLFELYQVYACQVDQPQSFDAFLYYCETILADFDDIEKYNVDAKSLFTVIAEIKEIDYLLEYLNENQKEALKQFWGTFNTDPLSEEQVSFKQFWEVLSKIYHEYLKRLDEKSMAFEGMIFKKAIVKLKQDDSCINFKKIAFIGFNALNYFERELFGYLKKTNKGLFFWDYDASYLQPSIAHFHQAAYFLRDFVHKYPAPDDFEFDSRLTASKEFETIALPTISGQTKCLAGILSDYKPTDKGAVNDLLICLADESLLPQVVKSLPEHIGSVNISLGYPLKDTQSYSFLEQLINVYSNCRQTNQQLTFHYKDVLRLVQNGIFSDNDRKHFTSIRQTIHDKSLLWFPSDAINTSSDLVQKIFATSLDTIDFVPHLKKLIKTIIQTNGASSSDEFNLEREALILIHQQLTRFGELIIDAPVELSLHVQAQLLKRYLEKLSLAFTGEPLLGTQLMGMLETRTIDFRQIVFISMNEGVYPKVTNIPSLIPQTLRKGFGLPTPEHRDAIFAYYFYRLMHRAEKVTILYSTRENGLSKGELSRFVQQLQYQYKFPMRQHHLVYNIKSSASNQIQIPFNAKAQSKIDDYISGKKAFSPSAINTFLSCSLKYYFQQIEGLRSENQMQDDISPNQFGNILHQTIFKLYGSYSDEIVTKEIIHHIQNNTSLIQSTVENAIAEEFKRTTDDAAIDFRGNLLLTREVVQRYIQLILMVDKKLTPFIIQSLEQRQSIQIQLPGTEASILIGGIIDRMDEVQGDVRIIDYKTGQSKSSYHSLDELFNQIPSKRNTAVFQTFIYSSVISRLKPNVRIVPGLYFLRDMAADTFDYHIKEGSGKLQRTIDDFSMVQETFETLLGNYLQALLAGTVEFTQTTDLEYCKYCDYVGVCNRQT